MDLYDRMARLAPQTGQGHPYPPTLAECYREIAALRLALLDAHARLQGRAFVEPEPMADVRQHHRERVHNSLATLRAEGSL